MRLKRRKHARKTLEVFRIAVDLRAPYRVLCDGNFLHALVKRLGAGDAAEVERRISGLLEGPVELVTTDAVLKELEGLPDDAVDTRALATSLEVVRSGATVEESRSLSPSEAIRRLTSRNNRNRFVVATQDPALRDTLRMTPGIPLVFLQRVVLILEEPSTSTRDLLRVIDRRRLKTELKPWRRQEQQQQGKKRIKPTTED